MTQALVIPGRYRGNTFVPEGPVPDVEGRAELIVIPDPPRPPRVGPSIYDMFGKAENPLMAEQITKRIEEERKGWSEEYVPPAEPPSGVPESTATFKSAFDFFGKAPVLRSGEDIAKQIEEERKGWGEE